ncbi:MAG TPA: hypothetical protein VH593_08335 [Ktedonobacteraceae bacterium]|jgi:hypothetical protein
MNQLFVFTEELRAERYDPVRWKAFLDLPFPSPISDPQLGIMKGRSYPLRQVIGCLSANKWTFERTAQVIEAVHILGQLAFDPR